MTLTIAVNYNRQQAPANESTVKSLQNYNLIVTTFSDAANPDRHLRYFGSWDIDVVQRGDERPRAARLAANSRRIRDSVESGAQSPGEERAVNLPLRRSSAWWTRPKRTAKRPSNR